MRSTEVVGCLILILLWSGDAEARTVEKQQPGTSNSSCSSCGDIIDIRYPFRLKGDPDGCGDMDYQLSCHNNRTILELNSVNYLVDRIWYDDRKITVVDPNLANGSCALPSGSLSLDNLRYDAVYAVKDIQFYEDVAFMTCSTKIVDPSRYIPVPCLDQNESYTYAATGVRSTADLSSLPNSCYFLSTVPVLFNGQDYQKFSLKQLRTGFNLSWSVDCRNCRLAGGVCWTDDGTCYTYDSGIQLNLAALLIFIANLLVRIIPILLDILLIIFCSYLLPPWFSPAKVTDRFRTFEDHYPYWSLRKLGKIYRSIKHKPYFFLVYDLFALLTVVIVAKVVIIVVLVVYLTQKYKKSLKKVDIVEKFLYNQSSLMPTRYHFAEIIAMTGHLSHKLGQGGFGSVYKGQLFDGTLVAVKVLESSKFSGEEFINEVSTIGRIYHTNVVRLLGYCSEGSKRALIYEFMPNGSLDKHIFSSKGSDQSFDGEKLYQISVGIARGIQYLHNGCDVCILHFDIKPHNILLDTNFNPKVADFGLAKLHPKENNFICVSAARGTIGYIAPELISRNFGVISSKSDVYGFGMLLLEMVGGRRNSSAMATRSSKAYFPSWAYDRLTEGRELELQQFNQMEEVIARKMSIIALWCIQVNPSARPSITKVLEMLEGSIANLEMPPKPFFSSTSQCCSIEEIQEDSSTELFECCNSIEDI